MQYTLSDVGGAGATNEPVALQYRIGETGDFTNVPDGFVPNIVGSSGTPVNVTMPAETLNQPKVQIRVIEADAVGSDVWAGVDNIIISNGGTIPSLVEFAVASTKVNENAGTATIKVARSGDISGAVSVDYATSDGTATAGSDYTAASGTLNFDPNQATATFTVPITDDTTVEPNETVNLTLSNPTGATFGSPASATLTIVDDDAPAPTGVLLNEVVSNPSGTDNGFEYFELEGNPGQSLTNVYVCSVEGDNGAGVGSVDWVFNLTGQSIGSNGLLLIRAESNTSFTPDPGTTVVTDPLLNAAPIENGTNSFLIVFSPTTITTGTDFDPNDVGNLTLPSGASLLDGVGWMDQDNANDKTFGAVLTQPSGAPDAASRIPGNTTPVSADAWYNGDLLDTNDPNERTYDTGNASSNIPAGAIITPGVPNYAGDGTTFGELGFSSFNYGVSEADGVATITVLRTAGTTGPASIAYSATAGTATDGGDFTSVNGTLDFADGETSKTFEVPIIDDSVPENSETVLLTLSNPTGGAIAGPRTTATLTINDDDTALLLNEVDINPPGTDTPQEYVELLGTPGQVLHNIYFVSVEGDTTAAAGNVTYAISLDGVTVGNNGLIMIKSSLFTGFTIDPDTTVVNSSLFDTGGGALQNGSNSFLVISSASPITTGNDLDTNGDGTLDLPSGAEPSRWNWLAGQWLGRSRLRRHSPDHSANHCTQRRNADRRRHQRAGCECVV